MRRRIVSRSGAALFLFLSPLQKGEVRRYQEISTMAATTAAVASTAATAVKAAAARMPDTAAPAVVELRMVAAVSVMSFPGMVLVKVRMIAPAISPTPSQAV